MLVALVSATAWFARFVSLSGLHPAAPHWAGWFDQSAYLRSALAFTHGDLSPADHWYPLLYPLAAAPFLALRPADPFSVLDCLLFAATMVAFARVARRLDVPLPVAIGSALLACLAQSRAAHAWLDPWTTTLAAAAIWWLIERTVALAFPADARDHSATRTLPLALYGGLVGVLVETRPADMLVGAICLGCAAVSLARRGDWRWRHLAAVTAGMMAVLLPYVGLHLAIYGPHPSDYMVGAAGTGFVLSDLPWKTNTLLISARPWFPETKSILEMMPWLAIAAAGATAALFGRGPQRRVWLLVLAVAIPYTLLLFAFADLHPSGLWKFGNFHYFKWILPFAGVACLRWLALLRSTRGAGVAALTLALVLAPTCIRALPVRTGVDQPARMLLFRGDPARDWAAGYFAPASITDRLGHMRNQGAFHQLPDGTGERAIAIKRLFAGAERKTDPGEPAPFASEPPYARYRVGITIGLPCWARPSSCAMPR